MRIPLTGGAYKSASLIANAQRCVNLYPENIPPKNQPPAPVVHFMRPGLNLLAAAPVLGLGRCAYTASNGDLYVVVGTNVYFVSDNWVFTQIGTIALGMSMVSMADNGQYILAVDGTAAGYLIELSTHIMTTISDPAFYGADRVDYAGTCFVLNRPDTAQFYISGPNAVTFDPLDFGQKSSSPDPLVAVAALNNQIWLLGTLKGEVWYFSGAADFPFQLLPGVQIEHGLAALYSVAVTDKFMFWLTRDKDGKPWVARGGTDYAVKRVSTHALEDEIQKYVVTYDGIGFCEQHRGHTFYVLNFPDADKTWAYDLSTEEWHERATVDNNGVLHRARPQLQTFAYGVNVAIDWQKGSIYECSPEYYTDAGTVFPCIRSFPHITNDMKRTTPNSVTADIEVGESQEEDPQIFIAQSITRGKSFQTKRGRSLGSVGEYNTTVRWQRFSQGRDHVFELSWALNAKTSLLGAFIDRMEDAET